jgi:fluoroquinolone resistance protein
MRKSCMAKTTGKISDAEELEGLVFSEGDLDAVDLRGKYFRDCRFENLRLTEVVLTDCTFEDCVFESCDLTMANVRATAFHGVVFLRCKLMGIDWSDVRGLIFTVSFEGCNLTHATFAKRNLCGLVFRECRAHHTTFVEVDLRQAVFAGTDLEGARFLDTDLREADLSSARNYDIDPRGNRLKKTKFSQEAALALAAEMGVIVPR